METLDLGVFQVGGVGKAHDKPPFGDASQGFWMEMKLIKFIIHTASLFNRYV
jgi:hypothetical protein